MDGCTLHELGDDCFAYVQRDGGWGWSNGGLIVGDGTSMLVDTLFDLRLTQAMLDAMAEHTSRAPIDTVVNTHANGDHCYGNQLLAGREIIASTVAAEEMREVPPSTLAALVADEGELGEVFRPFFGEFEFDGIEPVPPTRTFDGSLLVEVGGRDVELIEVGPAHTRGDILAYVPDAATIFTGDILFINGTPIVWAGPLENWIAACDLILSLDLETVVPGHGPVTDVGGVLGVRDYLDAVNTGARARHEAGLDAFDAARDLAVELGADERFRGWGEFGRIAVNVDTVYRTVDPDHQPADIVTNFRNMAALDLAPRPEPDSHGAEESSA